MEAVSVRYSTSLPESELANMIVDTHAHLTDENFTELQPFLTQAREAGVGKIIVIATTLEDSRQCLELVSKHDELRAAVGIHPNNCCQVKEGDWEKIVGLCSEEGVVALGETGLDKYWDDCPWEIQVDYFKRHLQLSRETSLPVVVHTRQCAEETLGILTEEAGHGPVHGVMHSFTGPRAVAEGCLELGMYISFAGMVTFKNAKEIQEIAEQIPDDRILVETDSPYLTPAPHRGKRPNHPAFVAHTLEFLAELRGVSKSLLAEQTTANAFRLFGSW